MVKSKKIQQQNVSLDNSDSSNSVGSTYKPIETERRQKHYNIPADQMRNISMWNDMSTGCFGVSGICFGVVLNCLVSPNAGNDVYRNFGTFFAIVFFLFAYGLRKFRDSELERIEKESKPR
jgi:hypothetical protein